MIPFVVVTGALNTVQSGANAQLARSLGSAWPAAIAVYLAGLAGIGAALVFVGNPWPGMGKVAGAPWWAWTGGLLGASYVMGMLMFAGQLGSAVFTGLSVTAAIVTSVVLDHFGLVGFEKHPVNIWRGIGAVLMLGGMGLVAKF